MPSHARAPPGSTPSSVTRRYAPPPAVTQVDAFVVGTHLVTCQAQPALGCVYKMVEIGARPCIKLSPDIEKITIPGFKRAFRLMNAAGV